MSQNPSGKSAAIVAYFTIIGSIIAIFMNSEHRYKFARFHIRQAFGIHFIFIVFAPLASGFNNWMITFSLYIFYMVLWFFGFFNAISNKTQAIPILGNLFQKIFKAL
ncbi:hypothetical protein [Mesohalobacter halotolerans]|jgi:uncharacterized membrane protein|uniref:DUF4870 domain-containing protein n=1 Tax=Mesohalobacter halotolerans TaxID=1883405 RepID=A0A4U5TQE3_9FLAO|nr:hypothetical protein [Mesohalobacter halotolerans]MBS3739163.1 hypothetical protein [Psychroflexus sp.]NBC58210.1 hypothetical protein [Bacteroidota bacterium]TKS55951.1 hypothetical protein FCN74_07925 [Mesohalobacter halotolerans]